MKLFFPFFCFIFSISILYGNNFPSVSDLHDKLLKTERLACYEENSLTNLDFAEKLRKTIFKDYSVKLKENNMVKLFMIEMFSRYINSDMEYRNVLGYDQGIWVYRAKINLHERNIIFKWENVELENSEIREIKKLMSPLFNITGKCTIPSTSPNPNFFTIWGNSDVKNIFITGRFVFRTSYMSYIGNEYFDSVKDAYDLVNYLMDIFRTKELKLLKTYHLAYDEFKSGVDSGKQGLVP